MIKTKYAKVMEILDSEIRIAQDSFNRVSRENVVLIIGSAVDQNRTMVEANRELMDMYSERVETLWRLKNRIKKELGV